MSLRDELIEWCKANMPRHENGRYYANDSNASDLQVFLRSRGFDAARVTVTEDGRFEVEREV